jgi:hypothetical protein
LQRCNFLLFERQDNSMIRHEDKSANRNAHNYVILPTEKRKRKRKLTPERKRIIERSLKLLEKPKTHNT